MPKLKIYTSEKKTAYRPCKLKKHKNKDWFLVYYLENSNGKLKRIRKRVKQIKPDHQRQNYADELKHDIDTKLRLGWNPLLNVNDKHISDNHLLSQYIKAYYSNVKQRYISKDLRYDSYRTYKSYIQVVQDYLSEFCPDTALKDYNKAFIIKYLEYVRHERQKTARYTNNFLQFFRTFSNFLIDRGHIAENPTRNIKPIPNQKKKREIIPENELKQILKAIEKQNKAYYLICLLTYTCFIRRTELTKIKIKDISFERQIIKMRSEVSKNKKNEYVTLPNFLNEPLKDHIQNKPEHYFVFSKTLSPGTENLHPKKISEIWAKFRREINFKKTYQFYSLKDTGITKLFYLNIPILKIRNQARHYDIKITESYTPRLEKADEKIKNLDLF